MGFTIKKLEPFSKTFEIPGWDGATVTLSEKSLSDLSLTRDSMLTRLTLELPIKDELIRRYCDSITAWAGIDDEKGKPFKFSQLNKELFLSQNVTGEDGKPMAMPDWLSICLAELRTEAEKEREEAEKN